MTPQIFICTARDIDESWGAIDDDSEYWREIDLELEAELGRWPSRGGGILEETDVELVPVELLW